MTATKIVLYETPNSAAMRRKTSEQLQITVNVANNGTIITFKTLNCQIDNSKQHTSYHPTSNKTRLLKLNGLMNTYF